MNFWKILAIAVICAIALIALFKVVIFLIKVIGFLIMVSLFLVPVALGYWAYRQFKKKQ